jgi:hypothetical protein
MHVEMGKLIFLVTFGIFFTNSELYACSCIGERTVKEEIKASDAVFVGRIISKELVEVVDSMAIKMFNSDTVSRNVYPYKTIIAKFELVVTSKYKGKITSDTVEIYTGLGGGDCGVRFEIGKDYIVYGELERYLGQADSDWQYPTGDNMYWTNTCSRTTLMNDEELNQIQKFRRKK